MKTSRNYFLFLMFTGYFFVITKDFITAQEFIHEINGWKISNEKYDKKLIASLKNEISRNTYKQINSIIVIKNDKLLIEEYFNGAKRNQIHDARSVGKTFASAVLGIALNEGYIKSVHQTLSEFYDLQKYKNYSNKKNNVTIENLLTMSSGFDGDDNDNSSIGNEENMYPEDNWVEWALNLPMAEDRNPGDKWYYFTAGIVILGDILNRNVPDGIEKYADRKLFKPLGITEYKWVYTPQKIPSTAGGLRLTPLDFAKFGQLYKNGGKWNNQQILPKSWVDVSFQKHKETSFKTDKYGYLWWNKSYTVFDKSYEVFYCSGNGGNKIFVFTEQPLVIVITASAYNTRYMHTQVDEMMERFILPAIIKN